MLNIFLASMALGVVAGVSAGLFGIGGGMIVVPVLAMLFAAQGFDPAQVMIMAVATSLATIILTSISSVLAHHRYGSILWPKVWRLVPGISFGAVLGAVLADRIAADSLRYFLIAYLLYSSAHMAFAGKPGAGARQASRGVDGFAALCIGLLSSILGIGGGSLTVPYLVYFQTPMQSAVAAASACGLPIALAGALSYVLLGWHAPGLPEWSVGYIYAPSFAGIVLTSIFTAPLGAKLANRLPAQKLKRYFAVLLVLIAAKMIWF